jgi:hypothetical protein
MFLGLILSFSMFFHEFHFTFTVLDYAAEEKIVKCSQKVFYDDLEKAVIAHLGYDIRLDTVINTPGDTVLFQYYASVFELNSKKPLEPIWVGSELQGSDLVWLYVQYDAKKLPKELTISSSLFTELYDDQANIVLLKNMDYDDDRLHLDNTDQSEKLTRN